MRPFFLALAYFFILFFMRVQTDFFGSTWLPSTPHEVLADGIGVLGAVIIFCTVVVCHTLDKNRKAIEALSHAEKPKSE